MHEQEDDSFGLRCKLSRFDRQRIRLGQRGVGPDFFRRETCQGQTAEPGSTQLEQIATIHDGGKAMTGML